MDEKETDSDDTIVETPELPNEDKTLEKIKCEHCNRRFDTKSGCISHVKSCGKKNLKDRFCKICNEQFYKLATFRAHMKRHHTDETAAESSEENQEPAKRNEYECKKCCRKYYKKSSFNLHIKQCDGSTMARLCKLCDLKFSSETNLRRHMRRKHQRKPEKIEDCETCGKWFARKCDRSRHINMGCTGTYVEDVKPTICAFCGTQFSDQIEYQQHMKEGCELAPKDEQTCPICDTTFSTRSNLNKHMKKHIKADHPCTICSKKCTSKYALERHLALHRSGQPLICEVCGNSFKHREGLYRHLRKHAGVTFPCTLCDKKFTANHTLKKHMLWHKGEKPFICEVCGSTFRESAKLNRHMKIHAGNREFTCETCNKSFILNEHLKYHQKIHTAEKSFACELCDYKSINTQALIVHRKTHFMARDFQCDTCERQFSTKHSLLQHKQMHERMNSSSAKKIRPAYVTKPSLFCKHCPKGFTTQRGLVRHTQKHAKGTLPVLRPGRVDRKGNYDEKPLDVPTPLPQSSRKRKRNDLNLPVSSSIDSTAERNKESQSETGTLIKSTCNDFSDMNINEGMVSPTKNEMQILNNDVFNAIKWVITDSGAETTIQTSERKSPEQHAVDLYSNASLPDRHGRSEHSYITEITNAMPANERGRKILRDPVLSRDSAFGLYTPSNMPVNTEHWGMPSWTSCRFSQPQDLSSKYNSFQKGDMNSGFNTFPKTLEQTAVSMVPQDQVQKGDYNKDQARAINGAKDKHPSLVTHNDGISDDETILDDNSNNDLHYNNVSYEKEKSSLHRQVNDADRDDDLTCDVQCNKCYEKFFSFNHLKDHLMQGCGLNARRKEHTAGN